MWRVKISNHAKKRFQERTGKEKSKKQLAFLVDKCMYSQSRRGIENIYSNNGYLELKIKIASHDLIAVICQDNKDPLARWQVTTFYREVEE